MAKFIRRKVNPVSHTHASEAVRTPAQFLDALTDSEKSLIHTRVQRGLAAIDRGEYTDYAGRAGLARLAEGVKARGRKRLAKRARNG